MDDLLRVFEFFFAAPVAGTLDESWVTARPACGLVLHSPFDNHRSHFVICMGWMSVWCSRMGPLDNLASIEQIGPVRG